MKFMDFAVISMGKVGNKFPVLEHCCYGLAEEKTFPVEAALLSFGLKKKKFKVDFFDGNLQTEESILKDLKQKKPKKIVYHVYTPYIRNKKDFMEELSKIAKLYLVIMPFFWRDRIMKEFPFVKDVFYDGESGFGVDVSRVGIDYSEIELEPYLNKESFSVIVSKYCPYQCTYCNAQKTGLMDRDLKVVEKEIEYLKNKGIKKIRLCGNNLTINEKRFIELAKIMKKFDVEWSGDARINHMTENVYEAMRGSKGVLLFGIESANQNILDNIKKNLKVQQIIDNADKFNEMKIPFRYTFMFGFPWDSRETCDEQVQLRKKVGALNYHCSLVAVYPGTPLFEQMKELKLIDEKTLNFEDFSWSKLPLTSTLHLSKEEIKTCLVRIMTRGAFSKNVIRHLFKTKKIKAYPSVISRGIKLLIYKKRIWND